MSLFSRCAAVVGCVAAICCLPAAAAPSAESAAPFAASRPIPGRYIVQFKPGIGDAAAEAARAMQGLGGQLRHVYGAALKGFAATLPDAALAGLRNNPNVASIEPDRTVGLQQLTSPQDQATWGLDRIDQADRPLDTQYHFTQTGAGVNAFIVDTGIRADHVEFTGRLLPGANFVPDANGTNDCHGHGTHVAGTVGGTTWGVAKAVSLVPVRVLDCTGSGAWSDVIAGIDWVANSTLRPAVANLSLGGDVSATVDAAVAGAVAKGVTMVVAAGNNGLDACNYSPAHEPSAITVGASTDIDYRASYSNYGSCLDVFAPGHNITSASNTSATATVARSGTSMAAPHVAGVAALTLQANPGASPEAVAASIVNNATTNRLTAIGTNSPNRLVYSPAGSAPTVQPATTTVAFRSMAGSATRNGGNWRAAASVSVRDIATGNPVPNATVAGSFSPGGAATCVTGSSGACVLNSGPIKLNASATTTLTGTNISGTLITYDATQNVVTQIVISRP